MKWRDIRSPEALEAWRQWFDDLPADVQAEIVKEMVDFLEGIRLSRMETRELMRRQADKPSTRRKRRVIRRA